MGIAVGPTNFHLVAFIETLFAAAAAAAAAVA